MNATTDLSTALAGLLHEHLPAPRRTELLELFSHKDFPTAGNDRTYDERCRTAYTQLRWLTEHGMSGQALLADRSQLFGLVGLAAVVNPTLSMLVTMHHFLGIGTIAEFGAGQAGVEQLLEDVDATGRVVTFVITELGHGNSHAALRTEVVHDPATHELVVHTPDVGAQKFMAPHGLPGVAKTGVVAARLFTGGQDRGVFPVMVPVRDEQNTMPGVSVRALPESPYSPMDYSVTSFDHVRVPVSALLSDHATIEPDGAFHDPLGGREDREQRSVQIRESSWIAFCAQLVSAGQAGVAIALRYSHHRTTNTTDATTRPVIDFRVQQRALFGALATVYAMSLHVNRAIGAWLNGGTGEWVAGPAFSRSVGLTRTAAARELERVLATCSWRSGAQGVLACNRIAEYQGLAHILHPAGGDAQLVAMAAARSLAAGAQYIPPTLTPHGSDPQTPEFWLGLARMRERALHSELMTELEARVGSSDHDTWNDCFTLGQEFVDAHTYRMVLESFAAACAELPDSPLAALCALYAVEHTASAPAWHLAEGTLTSTTVHSFPALINTLCNRLAPRALDLVAAFQLPSSLLNAPVEQSGYTSFFAVA